MIEWLENWDQAKALAKAQDRPIFLFLHGHT